MAWLIIDNVTHEIVSGPFDEEPDAIEGGYVEQTMFGWPETVDWIPSMEGFVRKAVVTPRRYTFNEWVDLFSLDEQVAIVTATMADPLVKLIYDRAQSASGSIDPTDSRTTEGLRYLVMKGYVSATTFQTITGTAYASP